jgi:hypothetical protein
MAASRPLALNWQPTARRSVSSSLSPQHDLSTAEFHLLDEQVRHDEHAAEESGAKSKGNEIALSGEAQSCHGDANSVAQQDQENQKPLNVGAGEFPPAATKKPPQKGHFGLRRTRPRTAARNDMYASVVDGERQRI